MYSDPTTAPDAPTAKTASARFSQPTLTGGDAGPPHADPALPAKLRALFATAIVVTLAAGLTLLVNLAYLRASTQQLETFRETQDALERVQSALLEAETAQRGYLLTGRTAYLEPYSRAKVVCPAAMSTLYAMAVDDSGLRPGLAELQPLIDEKMAIIDGTIARFQSQGDVVPSDAGRQAMDRIRTVTAALNAHVDGEIASTSRATQSRTAVTFIVATLAALLGVAALVLVYRAVVLEHRRRNIAEDAVRDRTALLGVVAEGTDDWIFVKDREGRLIFVNQAVCHAFDRPAKRLLGALPADYIADATEAQHIHENDLRIMAHGMSESVEQVITTHGQKRTYMSTKTPRVDAFGDVIGLMGIGTDITERKRNEQLLSEANERLSAAVGEKTAQLADLSRHLMRVSEDERERLAAELHDELGSLHTVMAMDLETLRKDLRSSPESVHERLKRVLESLREAREIKRRMIADLRPFLLDQLGLIPALSQHVELWSAASGVKASTQYAAGLPALPQALALALFRILQEALTNVSKHARASEVTVSLDVVSDQLRLTVQDDGIGVAPSVLEGPRSHGIIGMQQRLVQFNGRVEVMRRSDAGGTVVSVSVPQP